MVNNQSALESFVQGSAARNAQDLDVEVSRG
jgi:hypothetical protein